MFKKGQIVRCKDVSNLSTLDVVFNEDVEVAADQKGKYVSVLVNRGHLKTLDYFSTRFELVRDVKVAVDTKQAAEYYVSAKDGNVVITLNGKFSTKKVAEILDVAFN